MDEQSPGLAVAVFTAAIEIASLVALIYVAKAGAAGTIPRNAGLGFRFRSTMSSDRAWTLGHAACVKPMRRMLIPGSALALLAVAFHDSGVLFLASLGAYAVVLLAGCLFAAKAARKAVDDEVAGDDEVADQP